MSAASQDPNPPPTAGRPAQQGRAAPRRAGTPLWARLLILAAFGCAGFVVLCALLVGVGAWWVLSPLRQVATGALVGPATIGVARTGSLRDDQGLREALQRFSDELGELQEERARRETPEWLKQLQGERRGPPLGVIRMALPEEATLVVERLPEPGRLGWALAVNFPWLVRLAKLGHDSDGRKRRQHELDGVTIVEERPREICTAFVGGTFVMTSELETMQIAIRRLKAFREGDEVVRLPMELPRMHEGWDAVGLLTDVRGEREALLALLRGSQRVRELAERVLAGDVAQLDAGVDWETGDRLRARLAIEVVDQLAIEDWAEQLEELMAEWARVAETEGLHLTWQVDLQRDEIRLELTLDGMLNWIAEFLRSR